MCTDCHGIHSIKAHADPNSPASEQNLSKDICARCHEGVRLSQEFGVPGNKVSSYFDSYHGLAAEGGSVVAANCSSCHGVHNILPSSDPHSTINKANLDATCGQCHKGVTQKFTQTRVHSEDGVQPHDIGSLAVRWVRLIYIVLILIVIGAMFLHNFIIWRHKAVARRRMMNPFMVRMTTNQRWQHLILLTQLHHPGDYGICAEVPGHVVCACAGDGRALARHHSSRGRSDSDRRGDLPRFLSCGGAGRTAADSRPCAAAEGCVRCIVHDAVLPGPARARSRSSARFNYAEKAEYWALVWGTALMGLTGIMIWAKVWVGDTLARWWVDVATAVHFYEAILATLAIVVWHFYQVFFDPDVYPMNWAWWDGKMPVEHYRHEHGLDVEAVAGGRGEERQLRRNKLASSDPVDREWAEVCTLQMKRKESLMTERLFALKARS